MRPCDVINVIRLEDERIVLTIAFLISSAILKETKCTEGTVCTNYKKKVDLFNVFNMDQAKTIFKFIQRFHEMLYANCFHVGPQRYHDIGM